MNVKSFGGQVRKKGVERKIKGNMGKRWGRSWTGRGNWNEGKALARNMGYWYKFVFST